jgi:hypothetical protein
MQTSPQEARRSQKLANVTEETRRADAQRHVDGRRQRLEAYAASLEVALAQERNTERGVELAAKLAQARREIHTASRPRVPQAHRHLEAPVPKPSSSESAAPPVGEGGQPDVRPAG